MRQILDYLIGGLSAIALVLFCAVGVARYAAPTFTLDWSDEVVVMLLVWAMFLTGYRTTLDRIHINVDLLTERLSLVWRCRLEVAAALALAVYAAGMMLAGALVVYDAWLLGERTDSTARVPTFIYFASLPIGMALILGAASSRLLGRAAPPAAQGAEDPL